MDVTTPHRFPHRPYLDGIRTLAVYLVVLYHADVRAFDGGFVGVDLFFVLSGFLVTNVIVRDFSSPSGFNLMTFYSRRVRRLLPAATVAVITVSFITLATSGAGMRSRVLADARASLLYFANWHFLGGLDDYFAAGKDASPLLHFWSLAIEEQFYFAYPILLVALLGPIRRRFGERSLIVVPSVLLVATLAWQVVVARDDAQAAYFRTDTRVYQLLTGATLALVLLRRTGQRSVPPRVAAWSIGVGLVGLVVIASSILEVEPSVRGIAAAACSALLVLALEFSPTSPLARLLGWKPLTYLGVISYATYLWHWPIVLLLKRYLDAPSGVYAAAAGVLATGLASLSYHLLELPVRQSPLLGKRARLVVAGGLLMSSATAFLLLPPILSTDRPLMVTPLSGETVVLGSGSSDPKLAPLLARTPAELTNARGWPDFEGPNRDYGDRTCGRYERCTVVESPGSRRVLMIGDSNAEMWLPAFEQVARAQGLSLFISWGGGCAWQFGIVNTNRLDTCPADQDRFLSDVEAIDPDLVVFLSLAQTDPRMERGVELTDAGREVLGPESVDLEGAALIDAATRATVARMREGGRRVLIVEPTPIGRADYPSCFDRPMSECSFVTSTTALDEEVIYRHEDLTDHLVFSVDLDRLVCPEFPLCIPVVDGGITTIDGNHLTASFSTALGPELDALLESRGLFDW